MQNDECRSRWQARKHSYCSMLRKFHSSSIFVAIAAAAHASYLVTQDPDLLALQNRFGIEVVTPAQLLRALRL